MGGSRSSSRQAQTSNSLADNSVRNLTADGSATGASISNVTGDAQINLTTSGVPGDVVGGIVRTLADAAQQTIDAQNGRIEAVQQNVADIAKSATATQTEVGQLVSRLAVPVVVLIGLIMLILTWHKRK